MEEDQHQADHRHRLSVVVPKLKDVSDQLPDEQSRGEQIGDHDEHHDENQCEEKEKDFRVEVKIPNQRDHIDLPGLSIVLDPMGHHQSVWGRPEDTVNNWKLVLIREVADLLIG